MSELNDLIIRSDTNEKEAVHAMKSETEVRLMLQLRGHGVSTNTVYRYLRQGGWQSSKSRRTRLTGHESWLAERFELRDCARNGISRCRCARWNGRCNRCAGRGSWRRGVSRRRRGISCRWISVRCP